MSQSDSINLSPGLWNNPSYANCNVNGLLTVNNLQINGSSNIPTSLIGGYLYSLNALQSLSASPGQQQGVQYDTTIYESSAGDIVNNLNGSFTFVNSGSYLVTQTLKINGSLNSNIAGSLISSGPAIGYAISGIDADNNGGVCNTGIFVSNANDILFPQAITTNSSFNQNIGGGNTFISFVRLS